MSAATNPCGLLRPLGYIVLGIQQLIENPLALGFLEGDFADSDTVLVDVQDGELVFTKAPEPERAAA